MNDHVKLIAGCRNLEKFLTEGIEGLKYSSIYLQFERAWAVGCTLTLTMHDDKIEKYEDGRAFQTYDFNVEISWSSTGRSPANARAAIALYSQVSDLGALVESILTSARIGDEIKNDE